MLIIETGIKPFLLLAKDGVPLVYKELPQKNLSATLLPTLDKMAWQNVSSIAIGTGPGSYIGMRVGATIAKGLAYARSLPLIPFPSPLAYLPSLDKSFAYIGDAKMGQCFLFNGEKTLILDPEELPSHLDGIDLIVSERPEWAAGIPPKANPTLLATLLLEKSPSKVELAYLRS